jgi:hypothetical protein
MTPAFVRRTQFERALCAAGALICYAAAAILAPSGARSQVAPAGLASAAPELANDAPIEPVQPARDAFAPRVAVAADMPALNARRLPSPPALAARLPPLQTVRTDDGARVTAIVTGQTPSAIVDVGGVPQAVGIGDRVAGARITAIDATAIELDNGTHLQLAPETP